MKLLIAFMFVLSMAWGIGKFSTNPSASPSVTQPGWQITGKTNYLSPSMKNARSTTSTKTTRLALEGTPRPRRPPSVSPSDGSTKSDGIEGLQSTATPSKVSSTSYGEEGINSKSTPSEGSFTSERIQSMTTRSEGSSTSVDSDGTESTANPNQGSPTSVDLGEKQTSLLLSNKTHQHFGSSTSGSSEAQNSSTAKR